MLAPSEDEVIELAAHVPWVMWVELPDSHSGNKRKRAKTRARLKHTPNVFVPPLPGCFSHQLHTGMTKATGEEEFVGDLHAVAFSLSP